MCGLCSRISESCQKYRATNEKAKKLEAEKFDEDDDEDVLPAEHFNDLNKATLI